MRASAVLTALGLATVGLAAVVVQSAVDELAQAFFAARELAEEVNATISVPNATTGSTNENCVLVDRVNITWMPPPPGEDWRNTTLPWEDVGRAEQLANKSTEPITVEGRDLMLNHAQTYFFSVKTMNTRNLEGYYTSPPIFVDLTVPEMKYIRSYFRKHLFAWRYSTWLAPGWEFKDDESDVFAYGYYVSRRATGEIVVPDVDVGLMETGLAIADYNHAEFYCVHVHAQNNAGSWSDHKKQCFIVDLTPPVYGDFGPVLSDPLRMDMWLSQVSAQMAAKTVSLYSKGYLPEGTIDPELWRTNMTTPDGRLVPYAADSFHYELLWEDNKDPYEYLNESLVDLEYANGQLGDFQVVRLRFAVGDGESYLGIDGDPGNVSTSCTISAGYFKGSGAILDNVRIRDFWHVNQHGDPLCSKSDAWKAGSPPGIYCARTAFGYFEALLRYRAKGWNGFTIYTSLNCENGAGITGRVNTYYGTMIDQTPPNVMKSRIKPGVKQEDEINWLFQNSSSTFNVSWFLAFAEPETDVKGVFVALGSRPGANDIVQRVYVPGLEESFRFFEDMNFTHNRRVFARVIAENRASPPGRTAGFDCPGVLVDLTAPVMLVVGDGIKTMPGPTFKYAAAVLPTPNPLDISEILADLPRAWWAANGTKDVNFTSYVDASFASWVSLDPESGVFIWEMALFDSAGGQVTPWREMYDTAGYLLMPDGVYLEHAKQYFTHVRAINRAGTTGRTLSSDGFTVDLTPPTVSAPSETQWIDVPYERTERFTARFQFDPEAYGGNVHVLSSVDPWYRFAWTAVEDVSTVAECFVEIGSFRGGSDVVPRISVGNQRSYAADITTLRFLSGGAYFASATCVNSAGLQAVNFSTPIGVDVTPPFIGAVADELYATSTVDVDFQLADDRAFASWTGAADMHTGMVGCWAALGSKAEPAAYVNWTYTGLDNFVQAYGLELPANTPLLWSVGCVDFVGNVANTTSDGFLVDKTPPECDPRDALAGECVYDGSFDSIKANGTVDYYSPDLAWWAYREQYVCRMPRIFDGESGVSDFRVGLSSSPSDRGPFFASLSTTRGLPIAYFDGLNLTQDAAVYCVATAVNGVGLEKSFVSNGARVDFTPPVCEVKVVSGKADIKMDGSTFEALVNYTSAVPLALGLLNEGVALLVRCNDSESGVASLSLSLGFNPGESQVMNATAVKVPQTKSGASGVPVTALRLDRAKLLAQLGREDVNGRNLYFTLRARNKATGELVLPSSPFVLDDSAPAPQVNWPYTTAVIHGPDWFARPISLSSNGTHVNASAFMVDQESGVTIVSVGLNFMRGAGNITDPQSTHNNYPDALPAVAAARLDRLRPRSGELDFKLLTTKQEFATATFQLPLDVRSAAAAGAVYTVWAVVEAENNLGLKARYRSSGLIIDTTPPVFAPIGNATTFALDGHGDRATLVLDSRGDASLQSFAGVLYARYSASDDGSGIDRYELTPEAWTGSAGGWAPMPGCDPANNGRSTTGATSACNIAHGGRYRVRVDAYNGVGAVSSKWTDGVTVDTTGPTIAGINIRPVGTGSELVHTQPRWVAFNFSGVGDPESGISRVEYTIGRMGDQSVVPWTNVTASVLSGANVINVTGLLLVQGRRYEVTMSVTNRLGMVRVVSTLPFIIDTTAPATGESAVSTLRLNGPYWTQRGFGFTPRVVTGATVNVGFRGQLDFESGLSEFFIALFQIANVNSATAVARVPTSLAGVVSKPVTDADTMFMNCKAGTLCMLADPRPVDASTQFSTSFEGVTVMDGAWLVPVVYLRNGIGMTAGATGTPFRAIVSVVSPGRVFDGWSAGVDADTVAANNGVWATWQPFVDSGGLDVTYMAGFGTRRGSTELTGLFKIKGDTPYFGSVVDSLNGSPFRIADGTVVYATVWGNNTQGFGINATSDGVLYDGSPPELTAVGLGSRVRMHSAALVANASVPVTWQCTDAHSNVSYVEISLGRSVVEPESFVRNLRINGTVAAAGVFALPYRIPAGQAAVARVVCVNGAGAKSTAFSPYGYSDSTPPTTRNVAVGIPVLLSGVWPAPPSRPTSMYVGSSTRVYVRWDAADLESGVADSVVCAGTDPNATDIAPCTAIGFVSSAVLVLGPADNCTAALAATVGTVEPQANFTCVHLPSAAPLVHGSSIFVTASTTNNANQTTTQVARAIVDALPPLSNTTTVSIVVATRDAANNMAVKSVLTDPSAPFLPRFVSFDVMIGSFATAALSPVGFFEVSVLFTGNRSVFVKPTLFLASQLDAVPVSVLPGAGIATVYAPSGTGFMSGVQYTVNVVAISAAGQRTTFALPLRPDAQPPVITVAAISESPAVLDGSRAPTAWPFTDRLVVQWAAEDDSAVVATEVQVCDGDDPNGPCFTDWLKLDSNSTRGALLTGKAVRANATIRGVNLPLGRRVFVRVRVCDAAGQASQRSTDAVVCDPRRPVPGIVLQPAGYITHPSSLRVAFTPFASATSAIVGYDVALIRSADRSVSEPLLRFTRVPPSAVSRGFSTANGLTVGTISIDLAKVLANASIPANTIALALASAGNVSVVVRGTNGAGLFSLAFSEAVIYDGTPPSIDPAYLVDPQRYALERASLYGTNASLLPSGLLFARPVATLKNSSEIVPSLPKRASLGSNDLNTVGLAWVGIVDTGSGLRPQGTLTVETCFNAGNCSVLVRELPVDVSVGYYQLEGVAILPNATFSANLTVTNRAGMPTSFVTSQPLLIDLDPPAVTAVFDGIPQRMELPPGWPDRAATKRSDDSNYWSSLTAVAGSWSGWDNVDLAEFKWAVCRADITAPSGVANGDCPLPWTSAGTATSVFSSLGATRLTNGLAYRTWVMAVDAAGNTATASSDGYVVDVTGPSVGKYRFDMGTISNVHPAAHSWRTLKPVVWGVEDSESAIAEIQVCLTIAAAANRSSVPLLPCTPVSLSLADVPPFEAYFNDSAAEAADALLAMELSERLAAADGISGLAAPVYLSVDFVVVNRAQLSTRFTAAAVLYDPLPVTLEFAVPIEGAKWDELGFNGSASPPRRALLRLRPEDATLPVATSNLTTLGFAWALTPSRSGVSAISAALGTECGLADASKWRKLGNSSTAVAFTSLTLEDRRSYVLTLNVTSGAGLVSSFCSQPVLADLDPPTAGEVSDGAANGTQAYNSWRSSFAPATLFPSDGVVRAYWGGFSDYGSGVARYSVRVCSADGFTCLNDWVDVGNVTEASFIGITPEDGVTYRVHVRGFDAAGNAADAVSPGQIHDSTVPIPPSRILLDRPTIASWAGITVDFEEFVDAESGIDRYEIEVSVRGTNGTHVLLPPTSIGIENVYTLAGDLLAVTQGAWKPKVTDDGMRPVDFFVTVHAVNRAGRRSQRQVAGRMDDSPPEAGVVAFQSVDMLPTKDGLSSEGPKEATGEGGTLTRIEAYTAELDLSRPPRYQVSRHALLFAFRGFQDPETDSFRSSEQMSYVYGVGTRPGADDIYRWTRYFVPEFRLPESPLELLGSWRGEEKLPGTDPYLVHTIRVTGLDIANGATVYATVKAINAAGLETAVTTRGLTIDATTPQSSHPQPLIDLQARVQEEVNLTTIDETDVNATAAGNYSGLDLSTMGYNGVGSDAYLYDSQDINDWVDADWSGSTNALSFAWRGWSDPESYLDHVEFSVVELGEPAGYAPEMRQQEGSLMESSTIMNLADSYVAYRNAAAGSARRLGIGRVLQSSVKGFTVYNESLDDRDTGAMFTSNPALNESRPLPTVGPIPLNVATADIDPTLPYQAAARGRLMSPFEFWGGKPLTPFAKAGSSGDGNVTVQAQLEAGKVYGIALRAYSGSSQFTQLISDGVRVDSQRGVPCFGLIKVGSASSRTDDAITKGVVQGAVKDAARPKREITYTDKDKTSAMGTATTADPNEYFAYYPHADKLDLTWVHFPEAYVQRPSALQRIFVCPEVDGYGSDWNTKYSAPGDESLAPVQERYQLSFAPVHRYSLRLRLVWDPSTNSSSTSSSGIDLNQPTDEIGPQNVTSDVPIHVVSDDLMPASDACCRGGQDRNEPASTASDVELRSLHPAVAFGRSLAVVASAGHASAEAQSRSYAIIGAQGSAVLVPLHHTRGASKVFDVAGMTGSASVVNVAASKVPSGPLPGLFATFDERVPGFALANSEAVMLYETHWDPQAAGRRSAVCTPPADCPATDTGFAFEDMAILSLGEQVYSVATLFRDHAVFAPSGFGRAVALHNRTVAVSGRISSSLRSRPLPEDTIGEGLAYKAFASVVQVCEDATDPLAAEKRSPLAPLTNKHVWDTPICAVAAPPLESRHGTTGVPGQDVAYLVQIDAEGFGSSLALGAHAMAVGAPATEVFVGSSSGAVLMDSVLVYARGADNSVAGDVPLDPTDGFSVATSPFMASLLDKASLARPHVLLDPTAIEEAAVPDGSFVHAGFGAAVDLDPSGSLLVVGAPGSGAGRGRVYAYTLNPGTGAPEMACYFEGGFAGFSRMGESVQVLPVGTSLRTPEGGAPGPAPDGTVGLAAVSFHGFAVDPNGTVTEVPASAVLAIRPWAAAAQGSFQRVVSQMNVSAPLLAELEVPRCPLIALVGTNTSLEVRVQLGLEAFVPAVTAKVAAFMAAATKGGKTSVANAVLPAVAAGGSHLLLADAYAPTWHTQRYFPEQLSGLSSTGAYNGSLTDFLAANGTLPEELQLAPASSARSATGRVWHTAFCPRDAVRRKAEQQFAVVPYVCRTCTGQRGETQAAFGGLSSICSSCPVTKAKCTGGLDAFGAPRNTLFELTDTSLGLKQGATYKIYVRGTTAGGRYLERAGPMVMVDTTPPVLPSQGVMDGEFTEAKGDSPGASSSDLQYSSDTSRVSIFHPGFYEDASGIDRYEYGASSRPCDGLLRLTCRIRTVLVDASLRLYRNISDCSQLEVDYRLGWAAKLGVANWSLVGTPGYEIPFNIDDNLEYDIAPLTNGGINTTYTWRDMDVPHGTIAFGCVIAYNKAGLRTYQSTTGVVYDTTPPTIIRGSVRDGVAGPDYDQQAMTDGLVANWEAYDYESGLFYHTWAYTRDPYPVLDALLDVDAGVPVDWDLVQEAVRAEVVEWEIVPASLAQYSMAKVFNVSLERNKVYYAAVRSVNRVMMKSNIEVSDGVTVGRNEVKPEPGKEAAVGFNTVSALDQFATAAEQRAAQGTVGSLALPPGGLGDGTQNGGSRAASLVAGALNDADVSGNATDVPGVVNPANMTTPKRNLVFGNYSFAIKAKNDDGAIIEGYRFAKPMLITLYYDVPKNLPAGTRYAPQLNLFNIETGLWEAAVLSCPADQRFENIDSESQLYSVNICHLTQFGVYFQQPPVALVRPPAGALPLADTVSMTLIGDSSLYATADTGYDSLPPLLWPLDAGAPMPVLDASDSYDPDGFVRSVSWALLDAPSLAALRAELAAGTMTQEEFDGEFASLRAAVIAPSGVMGSRAMITPTLGSESGVWVFSVTVQDMDNVTTTSNVTIVFNVPPTIAFSRKYYTPPSLVPEFGEDTPAAGTELSSEYITLAAFAGPDDVVVDAASLTGDRDDWVETWEWAIDANMSRWQAGDRVAYVDIVLGGHALVRDVTDGVWVIRLTASDIYNATASATVVAGEGLNALVTNKSSELAMANGFVTVAGDEIVLDGSASVSSFPVSDLTFAWAQAIVNPVTNGTAYHDLPATGGPSITIPNVTRTGSYDFRLLVVDPYGRFDSDTVTVYRHSAPIAVLAGELPTNATGRSAPNFLWCGPSFQLRLNATGSYDPDDTPVTVAWKSEFTPAQVNATFANDVFAPIGASPIFTPVVANDTTSVVVRNKLPMGHYAVTALVTDGMGATTESASFDFSVGADGWVAVNAPMPEDAARPQYACSARPTPSASTTASRSTSPTRSETPSSTRTRTTTKTNTATSTNTRSSSSTPTSSASGSSTGSVSPSSTITSSSTGSITPSRSPTKSTSPTRSVTPSSSTTPSPSETPGASDTPPRTGTPSNTPFSPTRTSSASPTPLPPARPLSAGSVLAVRIGPLVSPGLTGVFIDELMPAPLPLPGWHAQRLQSVRLGGCRLPATPDVLGGVGVLTRSSDGSTAHLTCVGASGELVTASISVSGAVTYAPLCSVEDAAAGACSSILAVDETGSFRSTAALPPSSGAYTANVSLSSLSARAAVPASDGSVVFASAEGVFRLPPGAASPADAARLLPEWFNRTGASTLSSNLHPAMLHVSTGSSGELFVVGKPPKSWEPNAACSGGGAGVYRFAPSAAQQPGGSSGGYECTGRFTRLGKVFASIGRGLTGRAVGSDYLLHVTTDSEVVECSIPSSASNTHLMACREVMSVSQIMGARFAFRGAATLSAA